jgi:hypothetical protein
MLVKFHQVHESKVNKHMQALHKNIQVTYQASIKNLGLVPLEPLVPFHCQLPHIPPAISSSQKNKQVREEFHSRNMLREYIHKTIFSIEET